MSDNQFIQGALIATYAIAAIYSTCRMLTDFEDTAWFRVAVLCLFLPPLGWIGILVKLITD